MQLGKRRYFAKHLGKGRYFKKKKKKKKKN